MGVLIRRVEGRRGHVGSAAALERGVYQPRDTKDCQGLEGAREDPPHSGQREHGCKHTSVGDFWPP